MYPLIYRLCFFPTLSISKESRSSFVHPSIFNIELGVDSGVTLKLFLSHLRTNINFCLEISSLANFFIASNIANILLGLGVLISSAVQLR